MTLVLDLPSGAALDAEQLRADVARELGFPVVWQRDAAGGTLIVRVVRVLPQEGTRVVVAFDRRDGRHDERAISLDADPTIAERDIVLLAGNIARDQTAQFERLPPPPPTKTTTTTAAPEPRWPFGLDFAPGVGFSSIDGGRTSRRVSIGALGALSGGVHGVAIGGIVDVERGPVCGLELAGITNLAAATSGAQIAGTINVAQRFSGAQIAAVANVAADDSRGAQIGAVNVDAGRLAGVQIGVVNYAPHADFQFGVVNVTRDGRFRLDAWTKPEMGLAMAAVKHGGAHYHWIYAVGTRAVDTPHPWAALGVGAHVTPTERLYVDVDLAAYVQLLFEANRTAQLGEGRAVAGYSMARGVALFAGPTINVASVDAASRSGAPSYAQTVAGSSAPRWLLWPGIVLGVELL